MSIVDQHREDMAKRRCKSQARSTQDLEDAIDRRLAKVFGEDAEILVILPVRKKSGNQSDEDSNRKK